MGKTLSQTQVMNTDALAQFISNVMDKKQLSTYQVARLATAAGPEYEIAHTTVWGAMTGKWNYLYPTTMRALAVGLGVTEKELWDVAQDRAAPLPGYVLEPRSITLPDSVWAWIERGAKRTRRSVEQYIEALVASAEGEDVNVEIEDALRRNHAPKARAAKKAAKRTRA